MIDIFVVTNRGLEQVSAEEMAALPGLQVSQVGYRHINARYTGHAANLLALRTVDDVFIRVGEWHEIASHPVPAHGYPGSVVVTLPPLGVLVLEMVED